MSLVELRPEMAPLLLGWYRENARALPWRRDRAPYRVLLSEIMLQQTRAEVVKGYFERFLAEIPTLDALAEADEEKLMKLWEGLGYYSRARNLKKAAHAIVYEMNGVFPDTYEALLKLPGVGPYTAGAIASICFDRPVPAVDGNVLRIIARIAGVEAPIDLPETKRRINGALADIYPADAPGDFTQALMELGATICLPSGAPKCAICPVSGFCYARATDSISRLPVRLPKRPRQAQERTVFMLSAGGAVAIRRRPKRGLLAGLWELPNVPGKLSEQEALDQAAQWGAQPARLLRSVSRKHIFTHIEWNMTCYYVACAGRPQAFLWADAENIAETYAVPSAFRMFFEEDLND